MPSVVVWSILLVSLTDWGEEKVMTIYDAGPLAAGPLCGLLKKTLENNFSVAVVVAMCKVIVSAWRACSKLTCSESGLEQFSASSAVLCLAA